MNVEQKKISADFINRENENKQSNGAATPTTLESDRKVLNTRQDRECSICLKIVRYLQT